MFTLLAILQISYFRGSCCSTYIKKGTLKKIIINSTCYYVSDKILGTLGEGTFGKVVKVKDVEM